MTKCIYLRFRQEESKPYLKPEHTLTRPKKGTVFRTIFVVFFVMIIAMPVAVQARSLRAHDDQFGYHFDPDLLPSGTTGTSSDYSISTTGVSLTAGTDPNNWCTGGTGNNGWVAVPESVTTNQAWFLQIGPILARDTSNNYKWYLIWETQANGGVNGCATFTTLSASTYPSLSGTVKLYVSGSSFVGDLYVSQTGQTYREVFPVSAGGGLASPASNDWTAVETPLNQAGVTLTSGQFQWLITNPQFQVGGSWQNWNFGNSVYKELIAYATVCPGTNCGGPNLNNIGVLKYSLPGVKVYIGSGVADGTQMLWCLQGTCPQSPLP